MKHRQISEGWHQGPEPKFMRKHERRFGAFFLSEYFAGALLYWRV